LSESTSREICRAAVLLSLTRTRDEERELKEKYREQEILTAAVDYGGEFISSVTKIIERAVVAAKREGIIGDHHNEEGAVAGATREAISQLINKAIGLNIGGKIGIARCGEHLAICIFAGIGLLHLNENAIGLGHRVI
jgi:hypothetical protein